ncbi:MAG TPA: VWA domain-containing protein [Bryobacteraceae bacterium]|nr:VWA domain-containing protein [Bryobacteraceae bacterium]
MQKIVGLAVLCASCWTLAGVAVAQNTPPADTGTVIRTSVTEVSLDLVVRDKKGKVVKNLKPGDIQVYEDGVLQPLADFRLVSGTGTPQKAAPGAPASPATAAKPKSLSLPLRALNVVCIVFQNLDPSTKKWAVDATKEFLKGDLPSDAWVGIFNLSNHLIVLRPFTTDRDDLLQSANHAFTGPTQDFVDAAYTVLSMNPAVVTADQNGLHVTGGELSSRAIADVNVETAESAAVQRAALADQNRQFTHIEAARQTDQINAMIQQFATLPGHKTVLLLTTGFISTGDPDRFKKILTTAANAKITFYGIDAHGLSENSSAMAAASALDHVRNLSQGQGTGATSNAAVPGNPGGNSTAPTTPSGSAGVSMAEMRQDDELHNAVRGSDPQAALRALSEGTGGFLIANTNDLRKPFQHIVDDVDSHYEAVYHPTTAKYDGRLRKIEIKLARPDLTVETRAGYFAMPDIKGSKLKPFEVAALMTLSTNPLPHAFDFRLGAYQFRPQADNSQIASPMKCRSPF